MIADENLQNRLVLITTPGKLPEVVRASTIEIRQDVVVATDQEGKRSVWQKDFYAGSAPLFSEDSANASKQEVEEVLQEFQKLADIASGVDALIGPELKKWQDKLSELVALKEQEAKEKLAAINTQIDDFLTRPYDINEGYTLKMLERLMELGSSLIQKAPERAAEIEEFLKPWSEHAAQLKSGKSLYDGVWMTPSEIKKIKDAKAREAIAKFVEEGVKLEMESVVVPQTSTLLSGGLIIMTLVLVIYMFLYLASSRGGTLTFGGAIFLLFGIGIIGGYIYYGYKIFSAPSSIDEYILLGESNTDEADRQTLERVLFVSGKPEGLKLEQSDLEIDISDIQVNKLLKNNTDYIREGESELFDLERVAFATVFFNDRVVFVDEVIIFGKSFLIRYELYHRITDEVISFDGVEVYFGGAKLPGQLLNYFWMKLRQDLKGMISATGVTEYYELAGISEGYISLVMTKRPEGKRTSKTDKTGTE
ncbi:MAG: hypothetical protein AAF571_01335 [Verrucomicrobiota bacterium]